MTTDPNQLRPPIGYTCHRCAAVTWDKYRPFCGDCGCAMLSEIRLQAMGLTVYPHQFGPPIRDAREIGQFLSNLGAVRYYLSEYHPTFRTTKIKVQIDDDPAVYDRMLVCTDTVRLELPIDNGWVGVLEIEQESENLFSLTDAESAVRIKAGNVSLHTVARA